ncbi:MAG: hypothetical protein WD341_18365 [Tistlia sp.]
MHAIPGPADPTAHYIALRALLETDASSAGDVGLQLGAATAVGALAAGP